MPFGTGWWWECYCDSVDAKADEYVSDFDYGSGEEWC
jgi:hypothetical protein